MCQLGKQVNKICGLFGTVIGIITTSRVEYYGAIILFPNEITPIMAAVMIDENGLHWATVDQDSTSVTIQQVTPLELVAKSA